MAPQQKLCETPDTVDIAYTSIKQYITVKELQRTI